MSFELDRPDSTMGAILALEGISDSVTIMHGPSGCKFHPANVSETRLREREEVRNTFADRPRYYLFQPRVPYTMFDGKRLIMGTDEHLSDLYASVAGTEPGIIGVVNSPGAALVGEDLSRVSSDIPTVRIPSPGFSVPMCEGFQDTAVAVLDSLASTPGERHGANIIGLSIWHHDYKDSVEELERILSLCGIEVRCVMFAGSSTCDLRDSASAELNIVVDPDFGERIASYIKDRYGTPYVSSVPLGFDAVENLIRNVCQIAGTDASEALEYVSGWRRRTASAISEEAMYTRIRGRTFSAHGGNSYISALSEMLYSYLGMIPVMLRSDGLSKECSAKTSFAERNITVMDDPRCPCVDVAFGDENETVSLVKRGFARGGVTICEPSAHHTNIIRRPILGAAGTANIIEQILNIITEQ